MKHIYLGGEGPTELGDWFRERQYQPRPGEPCEDGVLVALLTRMELPHRVEGANRWGKPPKYQASRGEPRRPAETQNVLGLALMASETPGCTVLVFARDCDRDTERKKEIDKGIDEARQIFPELRIAGGVAREESEAWILALLDEPRPEKIARPKEHLASTHRITTTPDKCAVIAGADLSVDRPHAPSLNEWLKRAREAWR